LMSAMDENVRRPPGRSREGSGAALAWSCDTGLTVT